MASSPPQPTDATGPDTAALAVVDAASRALTEGGVDTTDAGYGRALRILAEGFDAVGAGIFGFDDGGIQLDAVWSAIKGLETDTRLEILDDLVPPEMPMRTTGRSVLFHAADLHPELSAALRLLGDDLVVLATPIVDADRVSGCVALAGPALAELSDDDLIAIQLCGELLWRHRRHHVVRDELRRRAEIAEILADVSGRLHGGGVSEARVLLDEVFAAVGRHVGAAAIRTYEMVGGQLQLILERADPGHECADDRPVLGPDLRERLGRGAAIPFDADHRPDGLDVLVGGLGSGVVVPGVVDDEFVGAFVVGRLDPRPMPATSLELVAGAVGLLGQFRVRIGAELDLVRRGLVEQARSEIAESFLDADPDRIDETAAGALERLATVFGARRVRWVERAADADRLDVVLEWDDGSRPAAPKAFDVPDFGVFLETREPIVLLPGDVREQIGLEAASPTLVVPVIAGTEVRAVLTLTGDRLATPLPADEQRTLADLAGVILQARVRAAQAAEREYRRVLDDLQLRLAQRFLDRRAADLGAVVDWVLGELGDALDVDLIAFAEYSDTSDGTIHWWSSTGDPEGPSTELRRAAGLFDAHFASILDADEPVVTRSRHLPDDLRPAAESVTGSEFSLLVVPLTATGVALLLGVCSLHDRVFSKVEEAFLQQVIGQLRQFLDVVAARVQLEHEATHDALTGLANRRLLTEEFRALVGDGGRGALLMIDVDRFKVVNDSLGHSAGDAVLVSIAERISHSVRDTDLVGRFGGDEFAVMVRDDVAGFELAATAQRLIDVIRRPIVVRGTTVIPTCSVGIATSAGGDDVEAVLRHADAALYDAKSKGRDRYEFFDDARRKSLRDRLHLETALRRGVAHGEFLPWFQPEYDLIRNEVVGVEALVRWNHPTAGILEAGTFIDTAEEIGLAPELSRIVVERSFETLRHWIDDGFDTRIRVNVAAAQLQSGELADQIAVALDAHGIPAEALCIEITERSLMLELDNAIAALVAVRELGVEVAVDDFGTGFSSLARLKHLPVDTLKIDRSFVRGLVDSATDREIVRTIVWLSRGLGLDVVAEGVEHPEQVDILLELGCRRAQGWLWSPAVPADQVPRLARV